MNLNNMSREELIEELKLYLIQCKNTVTLEYKDWDGGILKARFIKGEYYRINSNEGGTWIEYNNGDGFDVNDPEYKDILREGFYK